MSSDGRRNSSMPVSYDHTFKYKLVDLQQRVRPCSHIHECTSTRKHKIQGILMWSIHTETSSARVLVCVRICTSYVFRQLIRILFVYIASSKATSQLVTRSSRHTVIHTYIHKRKTTLLAQRQNTMKCSKIFTKMIRKAISLTAKVRKCLISMLVKCITMSQT